MTTPPVTMLVVPLKRLSHSCQTWTAASDPIQPQAAIVSATQIDERALVGRRVTHLLLQQRKFKVHVEQDGRFRKVADFGSWSLYEVGGVKDASETG